MAREDLLECSALQPLRNLLKQGQSLLLEGLWDTPKALILMLARAASSKHLVVLTGGEREAHLMSDLPYFGGENIAEFPAWETLPDEGIAPSVDIAGKRLSILHSLLEKREPAILLCPLQACLQKLPAPKTLSPLCHKWRSGQTLALAKIEPLLIRLGYRRLSVATDKGEYAVRGGILDIFPPSALHPFRLEFFGDVIEEIRTFDPLSQKSTGKVDELFLSPASELDLLIHEKEPALLFDYLGAETLLVFDDLLALEDRAVALQKLQSAASNRMISFQQLLQSTTQLQRLFFSKQPIEKLSSVELHGKVGRFFFSGIPQPITFTIADAKITLHKCHHPFIPLEERFASTDNEAVSGLEIVEGIGRHPEVKLLFLSISAAEEEQMRQKIGSLPPKAVFERGYLSSGFSLGDLAVVPMTLLTKRYRIERKPWRTSSHVPQAEFHSLNVGDLVVHFHHGIAKYLGVEKRPNHEGVESEFLLLEYTEGSKLYVPMAQSYLVSRYIGAHEEAPSLNQLGGKRWQHARERAQKAIVGYAEDLLRRQAERNVRGGFAYPPDSSDMRAFEAEFPFVETEDQLMAIAQVKQDMCASSSMDRLICGDVGYGKTEVAMRAAFKAVVDGGKQVALLVPTTLLALQHFETFSQRMANFPISIGIISRFQSLKENRETLEKAIGGKLDILIGTHRLISKDVAFKDLGLLIIDEEQRFGVRAKEHLKTLKVGVDCLTLSATPIPRTLYLSLVGVREISTISTPPHDRLPIKTIIASRDLSLIQQALQRELMRDGQAFFIHNRVETIFQISEELQKLVPEARIAVAHGQMEADEIDTVFHAFKNGTADILVATSLIENGIDIPNANTIVVDRADRFGLADLYQLRGRVGRWNRPAYAYFLIPSQRELPELARKRIQALQEASGYGGGIKVAMRDLELRGAGDILGTEQSGQVATIGFHLYCKLLKRTIEALRGKGAPTFIETKLECSFDARLPEDYVSEISLRLEIYYRLGASATLEEIDALFAELRDRFGPPPLPVSWLHSVSRLRLIAQLRGYTLLKIDGRHCTLEREGVKQTFSIPQLQEPQALEQQVLSHLLPLK